jgi:hypothetical protein
MKERRYVLLVTALALVLAAAPAMAVMSPSGIDPRLRLEWDAGQTARGHPVIAGYVYNDYMRAANNVRLLVEALDDSGKVVDCGYGFVTGIVPVFGRSYFDVPLKTAGSSYRVRVTSFEWRDGG